MADRSTRSGKQQQPAAPGSASGTSAQKQQGKTKEATTSDPGNSDVASNDSAAKPPTPNPINFSAEPERFIAVAIGEAIGCMEERLQNRLETRLQNQANMLDYGMAELRGLLQNLDVRKDHFVENGSSQAAGAGDHQNPPFLPTKQHSFVHAETAEQGSFPKQERSSSFPPNLKIPNDYQQHQHQQRSPSPYHRSNTLAPEFGSTTVRWRPEDLGYFHGQKDDVHTWVDRIRELVALKGSPVVQANLSLSLRDEAENWYHHELTKEQKWALLDPAYSIEPWISALTHRFEMDPVEILAKLNKQRYTRSDAAANKDPIEHLHAVMKLTRNRSTAESLYKAYMRIDSVWQLSLVAPTSTTTIEDFVKQLNAKKSAWYSEAKRTEQKDSRSHANGYVNKPWQSGDARNVGNGNGNGRWQRNKKQSYQNDRSRDHFRLPPPNPGDIGPRVHHAAPLVSLLPPPRGTEDEDPEDPDVWHADSGYGHGCSEPHCQHWHSN